jgi:hypothetical protein
VIEVEGHDARLLRLTIGENKGERLVFASGLGEAVNGLVSE